MTKRCFGTKEFSYKSKICNECDIKINCKNVKPKEPRLRLNLISEKDIKLVRALIYNGVN